MKKILFTLLLVLGISAAADAQVRFLDSSTDAVRKEAIAQDKLVFIDLYATWCGPCKAMERDVFSKKEVGDFMDEYFVAAKYTRYDPADESPRWPLAARLGAAGFLIPPLLPLSLCLVVSYLLRTERNLSRYLYDYD